ncbi:MAG TPA: ATP-binding SpoIIE family protein phosphatase [Rhodopila sp.]|nr:ATP-binding SpoIIE family protein phosphatase [Rhodopila sp.]
MIATVTDQSQVAHARRLIAEFAAAAGLPEPRIGKLAIVVTELATNLLKHAGSGEILVERFHDSDGAGLEILAMDRGPGMKDVAACMRDGFSTAGSLGQGLGAIARQSDHLRIYSRPGLGTVAAVRFVIEPAPAAWMSQAGINQAAVSPGTVSPGVVSPAAISQVAGARAGTAVQWGLAAMPYPGERVSGDGSAWRQTPAGPTMLMVDGSGHGSEARRAADVAENVFQAHAAQPCEELVVRLHNALKPTRGAAVAVARVDLAARVVRYAGVGNISGILLSATKLSRMVSHNGIAGHVAPRVRAFEYPFDDKPLVILHSDGITSRWDLSAYPGILQQHPSLLACILLRDFRRGRDDASVAAMRIHV